MNVWKGITAVLYKIDTYTLNVEAEKIGGSVRDGSLAIDRWDDRRSYVDGIMDIGIEYCLESDSWSSAKRQSILIDNNKITKNAEGDVVWQYYLNDYFYYKIAPEPNKGYVIVGIQNLQPTTAYKVRTYITGVDGNSKYVLETSFTTKAEATDGGIHWIGVSNRTSAYQAQYDKNPEKYAAEEEKVYSVMYEVQNILNSMSDNNGTFRMDFDYASGEGWAAKAGMTVNMYGYHSENGLYDTIMHELNHTYFLGAAVPSYEYEKDFMEFVTNVPNAGWNWQGGSEHCYPVTIASGTKENRVGSLIAAAAIGLD